MLKRALTQFQPPSAANTMHLLRFRPGYMPIPTLREPSTADARAEGAKRIRHLLVIPAVAVISFALGVITAAAFLVSVGPSTNDGFLQPTKLDITIPIIRQSFKYNRTFSEDPQLNNNTDEAWDGIVPVGQGSVRYPAAVPQVYTLSVVHQLHCLWSLHQNYYASLRGHPGHDTEDKVRHMRHCFDYLRQSLVCAADATLEPVDLALGGVTGWGTPRVCRDYNTLAAWAEAHRVSNLRGFHQAPEGHQHGGHK